MKQFLYAFTLILSITQVSLADFFDPNGQTCFQYIKDEWPDYRYRVINVNGERTVTDKRTGLMWKQCLEGLSDLGCNTGEIPALFNWSDALTAPETINSGDGFAGFNDWRVPNTEELLSIAAYNCVGPAINLNVFPRTPNTAYIFSSTPVLDIFGDKDAWYMDTSIGNTSWINREGLVGLLNLRLVRGGN